MLLTPAGRLAGLQADARQAAALAKNIEERKAQASQKAGGDASGAEVAGLPPGVKVEDAMALTNPGAKDGQTKASASQGLGVTTRWLLRWPGGSGQHASQAAPCSWPPAPQQLAST
jgi:hypothetical protein